MRFYITSGSLAFMKSLRKKYAAETMAVMDGKGNSLLIHESPKKSVFQTPMIYDILASYGELTEEGFYALSHFTVTDEGRPLFEHWVLKNIESVEGQQGFISYRFLRPIKTNTYIVLTQWTEKEFFDAWKTTFLHSDLSSEDKRGLGLERAPHMFSSAPYVAAYKAKIDD